MPPPEVSHPQYGGRIFFPVMLVPIYQTTRRHILEDSDLDTAVRINRYVF